jgi:hypothetical protein
MTVWKRLEGALVFERQVLDALLRRGWSAEPFGQGQMSNAIHDLIRGIPTHARWMPDIIAAKKFAARTMLIFVDAKSGERWRETGRHDIETAAVEAADAWADYSQSPTYFVFPDGGVTTPERVKAMAMPGKFRGNGSGTPFVLLDTRICEPFDAIFGPASTRGDL